MNANKALWEEGDFTRIAVGMRKSGDLLVKELGIASGTRILDLGCGDGTTALPAASLGAHVLGVDIAANLVAAGNKRARDAGLSNCKVQLGDACDLQELTDRSFDMVVSMFGAMFAPRPQAVAKEMVRVCRPGGRIMMGNWIPDDPTLVAQILKICSAYAPPPKEGFVSPMTWGIEAHVIERFSCAGVSRDDIGPTVNAFEAAERSGRRSELQGQLAELFNRENRSSREETTVIPATYLRVMVHVH